MNVKLSFCIPTYNRVPFLAQAVDSIVSQEGYGEGVEIVISDNASTDDTPSFVESLKKKYPSITSYRSSINTGGDENLIHVINLARGEFCWYLGDDDMLAPGTLKRLLEELNDSCDICQCNRVHCMLNMDPVEKRYWWTKEEGNQTYDFSKKGMLERYLKTCMNAGGLYSFMSTIGFRRQKWNEAGFDRAYIGSAYPQLYPLVKMMRMGCRLKTLHEHLILYRMGQDSYDGKSRAVRVNYDAETYLRVADQLLKDLPSCHHAFLEAVRKDIQLTHVYSVKNICRIKRCSKLKDWNRLYHNLTRLYGKRKDLMFVHFLPAWLVRVLIFPMKVYRRWLRIR